jgi:hypothetical protein
MQHAWVAEYSGEPEREQRGEGAGPGGQAMHDPTKIGTVGRRTLAQNLVRSTHLEANSSGEENGGGPRMVGVVLRDPMEGRWLFEQRVGELQTLSDLGLSEELKASPRIPR